LTRDWRLCGHLRDGKRGHSCSIGSLCGQGRHHGQKHREKGYCQLRMDACPPMRTKINCEQMRTGGLRTRYGIRNQLREKLRVSGRSRTTEMRGSASLCFNSNGPLIPATRLTAIRTSRSSISCGPANNRAGQHKRARIHALPCHAAEFDWRRTSAFQPTRSLRCRKPEEASL
jgi:hypothetical protein